MDIEDNLSRLIKRSSRQYSLESFVRDQSNTFPRVVEVTEGFCSLSGKSAIENGQILILHEVQQEGFVVVKQPTDDEHFISLSCPDKVDLVPINRLNEEYNTVEELFMAQPEYFRVLDDMPSLDITSGTVMKICSRQNGVYHLECEVIGKASSQPIFKLPLVEQGRFQPVLDGQEYTLEDIFTGTSALSDFGIRFIDDPGSREGAETILRGKPLRVQRKFQEITVVATSVVEGEVLLFPANLDITISPALELSYGMSGEDVLSRQQYMIRCCLKQVERLGASRTCSISCPLRTFSLQCLAPPTSPNPHDREIPLRTAKSRNHQRCDIDLAGEKSGSACLPADSPAIGPQVLEKTGLSSKIIPQCRNVGGMAQRAGPTLRQVKSPEYDKDSASVDNKKSLSEPSVGVAPRDGIEAQEQPITGDEILKEAIMTNMAKNNGSVPMKEISETHVEENVRDKAPSTSSPDKRPIPKPRKQKSPVAPPLPMKLKIHGGPLLEKCNGSYPASSPASHGIAAGEVNMRTSQDVAVSPARTVTAGSQNTVTQAKQERVSCHVSSGENEPVVKMERIRHYYHKETVTLRAGPDVRPWNLHRGEQDGFSEQYSIYLNENVLASDVLTDSQPLMKESTATYLRYVNENSFKFASCYGSASRTGDNVDFPDNDDGQKAKQLLSAPDYVNNMQTRYPNTKMVEDVEPQPYVNASHAPKFGDGSPSGMASEQAAEQAAQLDQLDSAHGESRASNSYSNWHAPHSIYPSALGAPNEQPSDAQEKSPEADSSEGEEDFEDPYCAMDLGEPRERSDSYSYPYAHFLFPRFLPGLPDASKLQLLFGIPPANADDEEYVPVLPPKPSFSRPLEDAGGVPGDEAVSVPPTLPPKKKVSPSMQPSATAEKDDEGAYLVVDITHPHDYEYIECLDKPEDVVFPLEVPETCPIPRIGKPLSVTSPPCERVENSMEQPPVVAYEGVYSIIPDTPIGKKNDKSRTQAKFSPISLFTKKAKAKKVKQKKTGRAQEKNQPADRQVQSQMPCSLISPTHRGRDREEDFEDINTMSFFLKMRARQQELEKAMILQKATFDAEIARQKALCDGAGQDACAEDAATEMPNANIAGERFPDMRQDIGFVDPDIADHTSGLLPANISTRHALASLHLSAESAGRHTHGTASSPPGPDLSKQPAPKARKRK